MKFRVLVDNYLYYWTIWSERKGCSRNQYAGQKEVSGIKRRFGSERMWRSTYRRTFGPNRSACRGKVTFPVLLTDSLGPEIFCRPGVRRTCACANVSASPSCCVFPIRLLQHPVVIVTEGSKKSPLTAPPDCECESERARQRAENKRHRVVLQQRWEVGLFFCCDQIFIAVGTGGSPSLFVSSSQAASLDYCCLPVLLTGRCWCTVACVSGVYEMEIHVCWFPWTHSESWCCWGTHSRPDRGPYMPW